MALRPPGKDSSKTSEPSPYFPGQRPTQRRPPPPSLASLDKLNPFKSPSATSLSSNYLTPPVTGTPHDSPPPLLLANDYLNAHADPKKRRHASGKKLYSSPGYFPAGDPESPTSGSERGDTRSIATAVDSLVEKGRALSPAIGVKRQATLKLSTPAFSGPKVQGTSTLAVPTQGSLDAKNDAATTSLRKMSYSSKEPSLFGSRRLSRISQAVINTIHQSKATSESENEGAAEISRDVDHGESEEPSPWQRPSGPKGHLLRGTNLEYDTPATITLRKASDAYFVVIGPRAGNGEFSTSGSMSYPLKPPPSDRKPSVALMDFRSKRLTEHRKSLWYSLPLLSEQSGQAESPAEDNDDAKSTPTGQEAIHESLDIFKNVQEPSALAEPAITFTNVHTAPQTFASIPYASSTIKRLRRTSSIQVRTRTSVHEIIWREDENSSGSSSRSSISPIQTSKPALSINTATPTTTKAQSAPVTPTSHIRDSTLQALPEENLFEWSWDTQQAGVPAITHSLTDPPATAPIEGASNTRAQRRSISKGSSQSSVHSFPPLIDRQNTTEWRRAPLVDLHDPMAGRVTRMWLPHIASEGNEGPRFLSEEPASFSAGSFGKRASMDGEGGREGVAERRRRSSAHPYAPARVGLSGRVGSSVGSSSHKRMVCFV